MNIIQLQLQKIKMANYHYLYKISKKIMFRFYLIKRYMNFYYTILHPSTLKKLKNQHLLTVGDVTESFTVYIVIYKLEKKDI